MKQFFMLLVVGASFVSVSCSEMTTDELRSFCSELKPLIIASLIENHKKANEALYRVIQNKFSPLPHKKNEFYDILESTIIFGA